METCITMFILTFMTFTAVAEDQGLARRILKASNPYDVLGVTPGASKDEVKKAHIELVKIFYGASNQGDPVATQVMQRLNSARDTVDQKPRIDNAARGSTWDGGGGGTGTRGGNDAGWRSYHDRMATAANAEGRAKVRDDQVKNARGPQDFATIAAQYPLTAEGASESVAFASKNMKAFMALNPSLLDLNTLAATGISAEGQQAIYGAALRSSTSAAQMIEMLKPSSGPSSGGQAWPENLAKALDRDLKRFFELNPSAEEVNRMRATMSISYRQRGEKMFYDAAARAGRAGENSAARAGVGGNLYTRTMDKIVRRLFAVDPSLVTGVATAVVSAEEAKALDQIACPASFIKTNGRILTAEYKRLLALTTKDDQDLTVVDCAKTSPELGAKLRALLDENKKDALDNLTKSGGRARCEVGRDGLDVGLILPNGLKAQIRFATPNKLGSVELTSQPGQAHPNNFMRLEYGGNPDLAFSYSAFGPKTPTPRNKLPIIRESEQSFATRITCARERCDHNGFLEKTVRWDTNSFTFPDRGEPDEHRPFGDLDKTYLAETSQSFNRITTVLRSLSNAERTFARVCREFGGEPPQTAGAMALTPNAPPSGKVEGGATGTGR